MHTHHSHFPCEGLRIIVSHSPRSSRPLSLWDIAIVVELGNLTLFSWSAATYSEYRTESPSHPIFHWLLGVTDAENSGSFFSFVAMNTYWTTMVLVFIDGVVSASPFWCTKICFYLLHNFLASSTKMLLGPCSDLKSHCTIAFSFWKLPHRWWMLFGHSEVNTFSYFSCSWHEAMRDKFAGGISAMQSHFCTLERGYTSCTDFQIVRLVYVK